LAIYLNNDVAALKPAFWAVEFAVTDRTSTPSFTPKNSASCGLSASLSIPSIGLRQLISVRGISGIVGTAGIRGISGGAGMERGSEESKENARRLGCRWPMVAVSV